MRITKEMLLRRIERMENFMQADIQSVSDQQIMKLRRSKGFVDVCQYGVGIPHRKEVGRIGGTRYFVGPLDQWGKS